MSDDSRPGDEHLSIGDQPQDVEEIRSGRGPGATQLAGGEIEMRQPAGLWVLFVTEMWERFSYYGMRALFVLFLIGSAAELLPDMEKNWNPGFGWSEAKAYGLYGTYTFMVYLTSIFGGMAADRLLGTHRSMLVGGWIIAAGHIALAGMVLFPHELGAEVTLEHGGASLLCFLVGCTLIIIGTGFFKPCVSVMVGQLYGENDPRRDSGFTIFYMGINLGAFLSPLVAGSLAKFVGWHWGFGSAAVGMILGLVFYQAFRNRYLRGIGDPPERQSARSRQIAYGALAVLVGIPVLPLVLFVSGGLDPIMRGWSSLVDFLGPYGLPITVLVILGAAIAAFLGTQPRADRGRLAVILILAFIGNIFFWTAFEQAGSSMNVFAEKSTDRTLPAWFVNFLSAPASSLWWIVMHIASLLVLPLVVKLVGIVVNGRDPAGRPLIPWWAAIVTFFAGIVPLLFTVLKWFGALEELETGFQFPAEYYQSVNALTILIFAPIFAWLWMVLEKKRCDPSTPMKFAIGLWLLGLSFLAMVLGSIDAKDGPAAPHWLLITYVVYTWGELCLSPVGLSMVTKLAPKRLQSLMMGLWFFTFALSNLSAALVAVVSTKFVPDAETGAPAEMKFILDGLPGFYLMLVVFPIGAGIFIACLTPWIKRLMGGIR